MFCVAVLGLAGLWVGMMSLQLRPLMCTALPTVDLGKHCKCCAVVAKAVGVFHGTSRSSSSGPAYVALGTQTSDVHIMSCRGPTAGGGVVAGAVCRHMIVETRAVAGLGPTVASLAATKALVVSMLSVTAHSLQVHTHPWACTLQRRPAMM